MLTERTLTDLTVEPLWFRQRDRAGILEPAMWFGRFDVFRQIGTERTVEEAWRRVMAQKPPDDAKRRRATRPHTGWWPNSRAWLWMLRAEAWDQYMHRLALAEEEAKWLGRQMDQREWEWTAAGQLRERIEQMLRYPLAQVTQPDGEGGMTVVHPVRWSHRDMAAFAKTASELGRLATQMEQRREHLDVDFGAKEFLDALPPEFRATVREWLIDYIKRNRSVDRR